MEKIKYTHIMPINSFVYNDQIISMIKNKEQFDLKEHRFIFTNSQNYSEYKDLENVIFEDNLLGKNVNLLREYIKNTEIVLMHSFALKHFHLYKLNNSDFKKIVWIVWGHDLYKKNNILKLEKGMSFYRTLRRIVSICLNKINLLVLKTRIKSLKAIGIGFKYDSLEIKKLYGNNIKIVKLPYGFKENKKKIDLILKDEQKIAENKPIKIMIGHSGYKFLNHEKIMNQLLKYKEENILISLPLSYGCIDYREDVKKIAEKLFNNKTEVLEKLMPFEEYLNYLRSVDIAILDFNHQAALGNIYLLLYLGKKIYLSKDGIIYYAMLSENIKVGKTDDIGVISYNEFIKGISDFDLKAYEYSNYILDESNLEKEWELTLKNLNY